MTLETGEEWREKRITGAVEKVFVSKNLIISFPIARRFTPSVERGERALPWRFITAAVLIASDCFTIWLDLHQGRSVYTSILKLVFSQELLCNPQ